MKKQYMWILLPVMLCLLAACGCKHEFAEPQCEAPKTCTLCGFTEGAPLGHHWQAATCEAPKTCSYCGETEGEALGHMFPDGRIPNCEAPAQCTVCGAAEHEARQHAWLAATCDSPKTCSVCHMIEGEKLEHIWQAATCDAAESCALCGLTEGAPIGHNWLAATCETSKTCESCGASEGEARGHNWQEATCVTPRLCQSCHITEGEALSHDWQEATSDEPKTCKLCGMVDGEKIEVDSRFWTPACQFLFGNWKSQITESVEMDGTVYSVSYWKHYTFRNDGTGCLYVVVEDRKEFLELYEDVLVAAMYAQFEQMGLLKLQAEAAFYQQYGMTIREYCAQLSVDLLEQMEKPQEFVYYVSGKKIYMGESWKGELEGTEYRKVGDKLQIETGEILSPVN